MLPYARVDAGTLHRVHRGVYSVAPPSVLRQEARWLAAVASDWWAAERACALIAPRFRVRSAKPLFRPHVQEVEVAPPHFLKHLGVHVPVEQEQVDPAAVALVVQDARRAAGTAGATGTGPASAA